MCGTITEKRQEREMSLQIYCLAGFAFCCFSFLRRITSEVIMAPKNNIANVRMKIRRLVVSSKKKRKMNDRIMNNVRSLKQKTWWATTWLKWLFRKNGSKKKN